MRRYVLGLGLTLFALTIAFSGAWAVHRFQRTAVASAALPADTRIEVRPLGRGPTAIRVLVRKGTVRLHGASVSDSALQAAVPAVLLVSPEATWLRIMTDPDSHAVQVHIAGVALKPHERAPWGRVVTLRKVDDRWQAEPNFLQADSLPERARPRF
jgi:hypothetical protein